MIIQLLFLYKAKMRILITGISGLIGTALKDYFISQGHDVIGFSLKLSKDKKNLEDIKRKLIDTVSKIDVVINLSGESIDQRWTKGARKRIYDSRINSTKLLVNTLLQIANSKISNKPKIFITASSIGVYGNEIAATEASSVSSNTDFIRHVVKDWEAATFPLDQNKTGIRRVNIRFGTVLSPKGGFLGKMIGIFKFGLGGHQGSGDQLISWIDIEDVVRSIYFCIINETIQGPVNIVSPQIITNNHLCKALGKTLKKSVWLSVPGWALELLLGKEFAQEIILKNFTAYPKKLLDAGFIFNYPKIEESLDHLLKDKELK